MWIRADQVNPTILPSHQRRARGSERPAGLCSDPGDGSGLDGVDDHPCRTLDSRQQRTQGVGRPAAEADVAARRGPRLNTRAAVANEGHGLCFHREQCRMPAAHRHVDAAARARIRVRGLRIELSAGASQGSRSDQATRRPGRRRGRQRRTTDARRSRSTTVP